ncbi:GIY-YIG nuclease family protein [Stappia sp. BW2]|uniref:GIY-YIG nuclease family protein n=1 Tax=Stappia sp. BW2 TaxID=2592622 RepID=UPI0011DE9285|nr:GIY-YIG nuclease family protein [Stappia sp. BW2]TYC65468.1 GIY-YIG nuclease family protein [Stappia sp. BW2]
MRQRNPFAVYILASKTGGTLYVGMTNDLLRRTWEHRNGLGSSFTKAYTVNRLVYFELFERPEEAYQRERNIKRWKRAWKIRMIEEANPDWIDLFPGLAAT